MHDQDILQLTVFATVFYYRIVFGWEALQSVLLYGTGL